MKQIVLDHIRFDRTLLLSLARLFHDDPGTCLLFSGGNFETSKWSYLCLFPYDFLTIRGNKQWKTNIETNTHNEVQFDNPWDALKYLIGNQFAGHSYPEWAGFISYEMGAFSDAEGRLAPHAAKIPYVYLQRSAVIIAVEHEKEIGTVIIADQAPYLFDEEKQRWIERFSSKDHWIDLVDHLTQADFSPSPYFPPTVAIPSESREEYLSKVFKAQEMIKTGDISQVNLSQKFTVTAPRNPFQLFYALAALHPAPFSAFLKHRDFAIVSSSPERFLYKRGDTLETRPIKGTISCGKTVEEDQRNREYLLNTKKENAELLKIIDLMRSDLEKVSCAGSVAVPQLWECQAYSNVYHLVSTIRSKVLPGLHPIDILRLCFPGGTITGYPKRSAMEVIAALENRSRGVYTGSIGYIAGNGDFDFNIAIRTLMMWEGNIDIQLGAAVVGGSDPQKEYEETLHKGA